MSAPYRRGTQWYVDLREHGGGRVSLRTTDEAVARIKAAELERAALLGGAAALARAQQKPTLGAAWDTAERMLWHGTKSASTPAHRRKAVARHIPMTTPLDQVGGLVQRLVLGLRADGAAPATIDHNLQALRSVLKLAHADGLLAVLPKLPRQPKQDGRIKVYSSDELAAICAEFEAAGRPEMVDFVTIMVDTGLRLGELLARDKLRLGERNRSGATSVHVWGTKNGTERIVPLTPEADAAFDRWLDRPNPTKHQVEWFWAQMRRNIGRAGEREFVIHALRHTCCTRLIRGGLPLTSVRLWMGHLDIETTLRYTHLDSSDLAGGVAALRRAAQEGVCQRSAQAVPADVPAVCHNSAPDVAHPSGATNSKPLKLNGKV